MCLDVRSVIRRFFMMSVIIINASVCAVLALSKQTLLPLGKRESMTKMADEILEIKDVKR